MSELTDLRVALAESLKLQTLYALLLNIHDGGERRVFVDTDAWIARLKECGAIVDSPPSGGLRDDNLSKAEKGRTRWILSTDLRARMLAIAVHHSRVTQVATDMLQLCRYDSWDTETLEYLGEKIENSHLESFGISMFEGLELNGPLNKHHHPSERNCDE